MSFNIDWNNIIKKEARGIDNTELEVHEIQGNYIFVQRGIINKEKLYIPRDQVESYDGDTLKFRLSEQELNQYQQQDDQNLMDFNSKEREQHIISQEIQSENNDDKKTSTSSITEEKKIDVSKESKEKQATKPTLLRGYTPPSP